MRFFITEAAADFKPLEGFRIVALLGRCDAGEGSGKLRAKNHIPSALVLKAEELLAQLATGLLEIEFGAFEQGCFIFREPVTPGYTGPGLEQIARQLPMPRRKVAESW